MHRAFEYQQASTLRPGALVRMNLAIAQGVGRHGQCGVPQRARALHIPRPVNLPVKARIGPLPTRVWQCLRRRQQFTGRIELQAAGELVQLLAQRGFKLALNFLLEKARQKQAGQEQRHTQRQHRGCQQTKAQRTRPTRARHAGGTSR